MSKSRVEPLRNRWGGLFVFASGRTYAMTENTLSIFACSQNFKLTIYDSRSWMYSMSVKRSVITTFVNLNAFASPYKNAFWVNAIIAKRGEVIMEWKTQISHNCAVCVAQLLQIDAGKHLSRQHVSEQKSANIIAQLRQAELHFDKILPDDNCGMLHRTLAFPITKPILTINRERIRFHTAHMVLSCRFSLFPCTSGHNFCLFQKLLCSFTIVTFVVYTYRDVSQIVTFRGFINLRNKDIFCYEITRATNFLTQKRKILTLQFTNFDFILTI